MASIFLFAPNILLCICITMMNIKRLTDHFHTKVHKSQDPSESCHCSTYQAPASASCNKTGEGCPFTKTLTLKGTKAWYTSLVYFRSKQWVEWKKKQKN